MSESSIIYTLTDEAPALATYSLLPILQAFCQSGDIIIKTRDISLAARILAQFPDELGGTQANDLAYLANLIQEPTANVIKLPNISASIPQLKAAITELQAKGYQLPDYPDEPSSEAQQLIKAKYDKVKGSAVNPVLREGNSDRRAPGAVKNYAKNNPHSMGAWRKDSMTHIASMPNGDFYGSEQSLTLNHKTEVTIELQAKDGQKEILKAPFALEAGEVIDTAVMQCQVLRDYIKTEIEAAREQNILLSLHLKATMMKVSDPIIFGHVVDIYYQAALTKHQETLSSLGVDLNNGLSDVLSKIKVLPTAQQEAIRLDLEAVYETNPKLAMVDSDKGITNLHVPSDIIIDASMPAAIRNSGQMWGPDGKAQDTKALIPDRSYAAVYQATIDFCKEHGAFDPRTMGSVANIGLMAKKAEEYGSHDKTFLIKQPGNVKVIASDGSVLMEQVVAKGDIFRMCQTKDAPIKDWVGLAVSRARQTKTPTIFWLDPHRAHDNEIIKKVKTYLSEHDTSDLTIDIKSPFEATQFTLQLIKSGQNTIAVTGNVLRDYLTDLFPILELGTSAKMLSIVPLMKGGGLFETGAGGSAPKHVQQFTEENHLRWDSLGEFMAVAASLEHLAQREGNAKAQLLAKTLDDATAQILQQNKSPSRRVKELDNRGSHFYLALFWARALAAQEEDNQLQSQFESLAQDLAAQEDQILAELTDIQGNAVNLNGYYAPDTQLASQAMRPSATFNQLLENFLS